MAPDKIYIQPNAHDGWFEGNKPNDNFEEYIRKDALLEWAKEELGNTSILRSETIEVLQKVIDKLISM